MAAIVFAFEYASENEWELTVPVQRPPKNKLFPIIFNDFDKHPKQKPIQFPWV